MNNKDQPSHLGSLISVVCCLDSIMPVDVKAKILSLWLASVAAQAHLSLSWSETTKDRFSHDGAHYGNYFSRVKRRY